MSRKKQIDLSRLFGLTPQPTHEPRLKLLSRLRYGENGRVQANVYTHTGADHPLNFGHFNPMAQFQPSNDLSAVALIDIERAMRTALWIACAFEKNFRLVPCVAVGVKHGNACGAAVGKTPAETIIGMIEGDPRAIFGGTVVTNFPIDLECAELLRTHDRGEQKTKRIIAGIIAPAIAQDAFERLQRKSRSTVALTNPALVNLGLPLIPKRPTYRFLPLLGSVIIQEADEYILDFDGGQMFIEGDHRPFEKESVRRDLALAWAVCWTSNSNTITIAHAGRILANAVGGQDRVGACEAAAGKLTESVKNEQELVVASDSFFPFSDGLLSLHKNHLDIVLATQGGEREREVAEYAKDNRMSLMWVPDKLGRGFFGH